MDTLVGNVPDHWQQTHLGQICDILVGPSGARRSVEARSRSNIPLISPRDLRANRISPEGRAAVAPDIAEQFARYRVVSNDIVCSRTGELGRRALVTPEQAGWLIDAACIRIRVREPVNAGYLIQYLGHPTVQAWIMRTATGSAVPSVNARGLGMLPVVVPPARTQSTIAEVFSALDERIAVHEQISRTTARLRDALLPDLLTRSTEADKDGGP